MAKHLCRDVYRRSLGSHRLQFGPQDAKSRMRLSRLVKPKTIPCTKASGSSGRKGSLNPLLPPRDYEMSNLRSGFFLKSGKPGRGPTSKSRRLRMLRSTSMPRLMSKSKKNKLACKARKSSARPLNSFRPCPNSCSDWAIPASHP